MSRILATSVVRGSHQGQSHGGVYLIDTTERSVHQPVDWNRGDIDWSGRGWDRGLRGIAFDGETVYIAASDELFAWSPRFDRIGSWRNRYLRHCHEIAIQGRNLYLTSTGFDSILAFDLDQRRFHWGLHLCENSAAPGDGNPSRARRAPTGPDSAGGASELRAVAFDPGSERGPTAVNTLHLNSIHCEDSGLYLCGLHSEGLLHFNGRSLRLAVSLPGGTHNARPFGDGVLFNDTQADVLRFAGRGGDTDRAFPVPAYPGDELEHRDADQSGIARAGFARGLCVLPDGLVAGGSSPSTVCVYDLAQGRRVLAVNISMDIRNAIHGLAAWPYD